MNFVEELKWRGILHDIMPGTEDLLNKESVTGYIGFDPTADSLHVGSLAQIMTLVRFQQAGHKPIALVGGATGMVGDPSGKSAERNLLDEASLQKNINGIKAQLEKFLDFNSETNKAELVNNLDWMKDYSFLNFIRDIGKFLTVNYMMAKDSVQNRLESGMSFTEFSYQLLQGFDFYHLYQAKNCKLQMGGSDQWGNITSGTELIRRKCGGEAFALTTQLIKKSDGTKFGKSEGGNIWLDKTKTSPYRFYQFWLNASDDDAKAFIRIFTLLNQTEIEALEQQHAASPHERILQKALAKDVTVRVHGQEEYDNAINTSSFLFNASLEDLAALREDAFLDVFNGVPRFEVPKEIVEAGIGLLDLLAEQTNILPSKGEARKLVQGGGLSVNREKINDPQLKISSGHLINNKYILIKKGRKDNFLLIAQ
ncbi:MAG: tyrosine--tRNA ligase [Sediminibacterium sp.]|nr:tyrosine--tRNA ligase [Sediminibacterium sp.]